MYRPPEMCDPFMQYEVNEKVDVWMLGNIIDLKLKKLFKWFVLGCVIYTLVFYKHPFVEASKLAIVNASITFPRDV